MEILILQSYNILKFAMKRVIAEVLSNRVIESSCNNMLSGENFSNSPIQNPASEQSERAIFMSFCSTFNF